MNPKIPLKKIVKNYILSFKIQISICRLGAILFDEVLNEYFGCIVVSSHLLGDVNLDWLRKFDFNYAYKNYLEDMEDQLGNHGLNQIVDHPTWTTISLKTKIVSRFNFHL